MCTKSRNKPYRKFKRWLKKQKLSWLCFILLFPLFVGWVYSLPLPQYIAVDSGDLLAFYGTAFGLLLSARMYLEVKQKESLERQKAIRPQLYVELVRRSDQSDLFDICVQKIGDQLIEDAYLYEKQIGAIINKVQCYTIAYCLNPSKAKDLSVDFNIEMDDEILDTDGYPKYIQILCYDADDNGWVCEFDKAKMQDKVLYIAHPPHIV